MGDFEQESFEIVQQLAHLRFLRSAGGLFVQPVVIEQLLGGLALPGDIHRPAGGVFDFGEDYEAGCQMSIERDAEEPGAGIFD